MLHSRYVIAALVILCLFLARATWGVYGKYERSRELSETAARDLEGLKARERHLASLTESLKTEEGQGREIRDRFGLVREGEQAIVIVEDGRESASSGAAEERGFWSRFLDIFR
jgi:cell division protein FtsB